MKLQGLRGVNPSIYLRLTIANVGVSTQLNFTRFCNAPFPAPLFFYFTVTHHLRGIEPPFLHASRIICPGNAKGDREEEIWNFSNSKIAIDLVSINSKIVL